MILFFNFQLKMVRTSPFSVRLTKSVRDMIEFHAHTLRIKPSVLAAMILSECTEEWVINYTKEIYSKYHGDQKE